MSQAARIEKFEKITLGRPPDQPLPAKTLMGPPRAINLGWYLWIFDFWPKTISFHMVLHKKATITLWFAKKPQVESVFFSFWVILGHFTVILRSFCGHFGLYLFNLLILGFFQEI